MFTLRTPIGPHPASAPIASDFMIFMSEPQRHSGNSVDPSVSKRSNFDTLHRPPPRTNRKYRFHPLLCLTFADRLGWCNASAAGYYPNFENSTNLSRHEHKGC